MTTCRYMTCDDADANLLCRLFAADRPATCSPSSPTPPGRYASVEPPSTCSRCRAPLSAGELIMRARQFVYHVDCFACSICGRRLQTGQQYALTTTTTTPFGGRGSSFVVDVPFIYCRDDYERLRLGGLCADQGQRDDDVERSLPVAVGHSRSPPTASKDSFEDSVQQVQQRCVVESPTSASKGRQRKRRTTANAMATAPTAAAAIVAEVDTGNMFKMVVNKRKLLMQLLNSRNSLIRNWSQLSGNFAPMR